MPILNWRELRHAIQQKQEGKAVDPTNPAYMDVEDEAVRAEKFNQMLQEEAAEEAKGLEGRYEKINQAQKAYQQYISDIVEEAKANDFYGYGESRYDKRVPFEEWVQNPIDYRANAQSAASKIINGVAKFIPYTGTTFLDNTIGTVLGLVGLGADALDFKGDGTKAESFINNWFSEKMQDIRDWSDKNLPNYRTEEEMNDQDHWWRHINANFIGDSLIKNLGFTLGAMASGMAYSKLMRAFQPKAMREAYKAAVAASVGGDAAAEEAFRKVLQGSKMSDPKKIYDTFASLRNSYKKLGFANQIIAGMGGAVGESRVEAISAAQEFRDEAMDALNTRKQQLEASLMQQILGNKAYIGYEPVYDGYGNIVDRQEVLNQAGRDAMNNGLADIDKKISEEQKAIDQQAESIAKNVFALNMPVLGLENAIMFGRLLSGGYKSQAKAKVRGNRLNGYRGLSRGEMIAKGAGKALSEGVEELTQKVISEGRKGIANSNVSSFHDGQYDEGSIKSLAETFSNMFNTAGDVLKQGSSWQEFAIGTLTGAIVDPVSGGYRASAEERKLSKEYAENLNKRMKEKGFDSLYKGLVRHKKLDSKIDEDLRTGDKFAWRNDHDEQLINDVIMWSEAGRLNDLEDIVDSVADMSLSDVAKFESELVDETDKEFKSKSAEQKLKWLKDRAKEVKEAIEDYRNFYENLDYMSVGTSDDDFIKEMLYTKIQLGNFEKRYNRLLDEVLNKIRPTLESIANETDKDGNPTKRAEKAQKIISSEQSLRTLFGGAVADIHDSAEKKDASFANKLPVMLDDMRQEQVMKELDELGLFTNDKEMKQDVKDLMRLVRSRQAFYAKLFDPTFREKFEEKKIKEETVVNNLKKSDDSDKADAYMQSLEQANSLEEYLDAMNKIPDNVPIEVREALDTKIDANPKLKGFKDAINEAGDFINEIAEAANERQSIVSSKDDIDVLNDILNELSKMQPGLSLIENKEFASPREAVANDIITRAKLISEKAGKLTEEIVNEKLEIRQKSKDLGKVPENPVKTETKEEKKQEAQKTDEEKAADQEAELSQKIAEETDPNSSLLDKIIKGDFSGYPNISAEQKATLTSLATTKKNDLEAAKGEIVTEDSAKGHDYNRKGEDLPQDMPEQSAQHKAFVKRDTGAVRGMQFAVYNLGKLSGKGQVEVEEKGKEGVKETVKWMQEHKVQEFLDSGALEELFNYYSKQGRKLPIFFLGNPHLVENNKDVNPFVVASSAESMKKYGGVRANVLLAIEVNEENRKVLDKYEKAGVFSNDSMLTIGDTKYQVIGQVYNPTVDDVNSKPESEREAYNTMRDKSFRMEELARKSIHKQYDADKKVAGDAGFDNSGKWYVASVEGDNSRLYTTLNYITPGWNNTRDGNDDQFKQVPLNTSMKQYRETERPYHFALITDDDILTTDGSPSFPGTIDAPSGSLWMATRRADGSWGWTYITIARAGEIDFEAIKDSAIMKEIDSAIKTILAPTNPGASKSGHDADFAKRSAACKTLEGIFYLGEGNGIRLGFSSDGAGVYVADNSRLCTTRDEILQALKNGNYRFQVSKGMINSGTKAFDNLINIGALSSEMLDFVRKGSMAGVNFMDESGAVPMPIDSGMSVSFGEEIGKVSGSDAVGVTKDIRLGDEGFNLLPDGVVQKTGTGEIITDGVVVAQVKAMVEAMNAGKDYSGKKYVIENDKQYTELFEQEVDGIRVRMHREGKNGAVIPISDERWDALMSANNPSKEESSIDEIIKAYIKPASAEKTDEKEYTKEQKPKRKLRKSLDPKALKDDNSKTTQEVSKENQKKEDQIDCG